MHGTATYGERVVVVEVNCGNVSLKTGRISSTETSHVQADNENKTVVWGDREFHNMMEAPDAYERTFRVDDIHLLKEQEAHLLRDSEMAQDWFGLVYQDPVVAKIQRALKRLKSADNQAPRATP